MTLGAEQGDRLITDNEVGAMYGIGRSTVWRWAAEKKIPAPVVSRPKFARWSFLQVQTDIANMRRAELAEAAT